MEFKEVAGAQCATMVSRAMSLVCHALLRMQRLQRHAASCSVMQRLQRHAAFTASCSVYSVMQRLQRHTAFTASYSIYSVIQRHTAFTAFTASYSVYSVIKRLQRHAKDCQATNACLRPSCLSDHAASALLQAWSCKERGSCV